jgi:flagellar L-ring protein precursor FlgH
MPTRCFDRLVGAILIAAIAASPALAARAKPKPGFGPTLPIAPVAPTIADGAIFQVANGYTPLYEGTRARAVGDPLTIVLVENITSSKTAASKTGRNGGIGLVPPATGPLAFAPPTSLSASGTSNFDGKGDMTQQSALAGSVSVTIAKLLGNGTAVVVGEKRLTLNQGEDWVQVSGIVRLNDIDENNRISSTQVADARIEYSGNGQVARASREGWLQRFFNMLTPF